jgi:hypothetical protein
MNRFRAIVYITGILVSIVLALYAFNVFPIPGTDSVVFIPAALLMSKGAGLANPLYYVTKFTDLTHTSRFNYYPPFYPYLLGLLGSIKPGIKTIFLFCSMFSIANLLLYSRLLASKLPAATSRGIRIIAVLTIPYIATYLLPTVGRPECVTTLFIFAVYLLYSHRDAINPMLYNLAICLLFSFMLTAQMVCFYFCFLFFVTYELLNTTNVYKTILVNTARVVAILLLCCIIVMLSPNGLLNTLNGIKLHIAYVLDRHDRSIPLFVYYWLLAPLNFGFLAVFLLAAVFYVRELIARLKKADKVPAVLAAGLQLLVIIGIGKFILYASPTVYNATEFILPISAYILFSLSALPKGAEKSVFTAGALATYAAGTIVFLRGLILFADYKSDGKDFDHAQAEVARFAGQGEVFVTQGLWPLFDDPFKVKIYNKDQFKSGDVVIVQQAYHPFPPELEHKVTILYDWRTTEQRKFMGIPLTNRPQGYSFVVCKIN